VYSVNIPRCFERSWCLFLRELVMKTVELQSFKITVITPHQLNHHRVQERLNVVAHIMRAIFVLKTQVIFSSAGE
jgi:hypothetical protein